MLRKELRYSDGTGGLKMKAEDKLKVIDKIIGVWVEWYSDDKDVEHGMMAAISAVLAIEEDNDGT